jgi:hypothetical protein
MEWTQFIIFFLGVFGLFIWNRTESRSDIRYMDQKLESNRELVRAIHAEGQEQLEQYKKRLEANRLETQEKLEANRAEMTLLIREMHAETAQIVRSIELEMKDFHRRLCYTEAEQVRQQKG